MKALKEAVRDYKEVQQLTKKQKDDGLWGGNMLGTEANKGLGIREVGTVARYRRLIELGVPLTARPFRLANRTFYRILSRDPDPALLFEHRKNAKGDIEYEEWARDFLREGVTAALAQGGQAEDPRVRGAAKRTVNRVSAFVRSEFSESPIVKSGSKNVLAEEASPPTYFLMTTLAYMPEFCRERAGFVERLVEFVTSPRPDKSFSISVGTKTVKPTVHILGDPLDLDKNGKPKDMPLALHWLEVLARLGAIDASTSAKSALAYFLADVDEAGVWNPKGLRSVPKGSSSMTDFAFPLESGSAADQRKSDVTFRLALIAKLAGWDLTYT